MIRKIMKSPGGIILISVVLGLGLATLFQRACKSRECIVVRAPDPQTIVKNIYRNKEDCYVYKPDLVECPSKKPNDLDNTEVVNH